MDPLTPIVKEGRMYGRGTVDMKGGLAAMMSAIRRIVDSGTIEKLPQTRRDDRDVITF